MQNQTYEDKNTKLNEVACHFSLIYGPSKFLISLHINISIRYLYIDIFISSTYFITSKLFLLTNKSRSRLTCQTFCQNRNMCNIIPYIVLLDQNNKQKLEAIYANMAFLIPYIIPRSCLKSIIRCCCQKHMLFLFLSRIDDYKEVHELSLNID